MAPDDQVEEVRDEGLGNVVGGTPLGTILIQHGLTEVLFLHKKDKLIRG
jgi:hypothetical protein